MPYAPIQAISRAQLTEMAEARCHLVAPPRPDLAPALDLQRRLLARVGEAAAALDAGRLPRLSLPPKYLAAKLRRGVPALVGEPIPVPTTLLGPVAVQLADALAHGGAGDAAAHIRDALQNGSIEAASLLTAS